MHVKLCRTDAQKGRQGAKAKATNAHDTNHRTTAENYERDAITDRRQRNLRFSGSSKRSFDEVPGREGRAAFQAKHNALDD